jgi:hypothetical protein
MTGFAKGKVGAHLSSVLPLQGSCSEIPLLTFVVPLHLLVLLLHWIGIEGSRVLHRQLGALAHQQIARAMLHQLPLLFGRLARHEPHRRSPNCLADHRTAASERCALGSWLPLVLRCTLGVRSGSKPAHSFNGRLSAFASCGHRSRRSLSTVVAPHERSPSVRSACGVSVLGAPDNQPMGLGCQLAAKDDCPAARAARPDVTHGAKGVAVCHRCHRKRMFRAGKAS